MNVVEPRLNDPEFKTVNGEDHLGIRYVAINISDALQPGITSITPRARYWSFFAWVIYDFIQSDYSQDSRFERTLSNFKKYLKQQECFFIFANIAVSELNPTESSTSIFGLQGIDTLMSVWQNSTENVPLTTNYLQASFGGYAAYRNVMKITGVTWPEDNENNIQIDRMTTLGRELAEAFREQIQDTEYYKVYRKSAEQVPKSVLFEYGKKASLIIYEDAKDLPVLQRILIPTDQNDERGINRANSLKFYKYALDHHPDRKSDTNFWREVFYDVYSPKGELTEEIPEELRIVALGWEIFQARQYFTYALEGIWAYFLLKLKDSPLSRRDIIKKMFSTSNFDYDLEKSIITDLIVQCPINLHKRRKLLKNIELINEDTLSSALILMLDVYHRIKNRTDFDEFHLILLKLGERRNISLQTWLDLVDQHKDYSTIDLFAYIVERFCINQHKLVALEKIMVEPHNQTLHFEEDDGVIHFLLPDMPTFNVLRTFQGVSIAKDIRLIG